MSLKQLTEILNKQKLVGSMVHNQNMQKHEVIESLLQKQHSAELQNYIAKLAFPQFSRHSIMSKLNWRESHEENEIYV